MQDMKLVEALNDLREEQRKQGAELRREVRQGLADVRQQAIRAHLGIIKWLVGAVLLLGLALGGKDILEIALEAMP